MSDLPLNGLSVLAVEDEYLIAEELRRGLEDAGATVLGPVPSVARALALVDAEGGTIDGAVLDVNLGSEKVFPVADALTRRKIPFLFVTGYGESAVPERYRHVVRCEKPPNVAAVARALSARISS